MQQLEVKLSQAQFLGWRFEDQLRDLDIAEEAQKQVTAAIKRFPALHTLTLGAAPFRVLDGAPLAMSLASLAKNLPPGQLNALTLDHCRLSGAEAEQLGSLVPPSCRLSLELALRISKQAGDEDDEDDEDDPEDQLDMIISGGLAPVLQSLYLEEGGRWLWPVSLLETLSSLTALRELSLPGRVMDAQAAQVLQGLTRLVVLRLGGWARQGEGGEDEEPLGPPAALPTSLRRLELLQEIEVGAGQGVDADFETDHHVRVPLLPLPPGTVLTACLSISIGAQKERVQERGGLEAWCASLVRELQGWVKLQRVQQRMELNVCLKGDRFNAEDRLTEEDVAEVDRLLPYVFQALAPLAASFHTLRLERSSCRLDTSVMVPLVGTLPSLRELSITACHLTASGLHPLSQLRQQRLLFLSPAPRW